MYKSVQLFLVLLHAVIWADKHNENTGHIFATFVVNAHYFIRVVSSSTPYDISIITENICPLSTKYLKRNCTFDFNVNFKLNLKKSSKQKIQVFWI